MKFRFIYKSSFIVTHLNSISALDADCNCALKLSFNGVNNQLEGNILERRIISPIVNRFNEIMAEMPEGCELKNVSSEIHKELDGIDKKLGDAEIAFNETHASGKTRNVFNLADYLASFRHLPKTKLHRDIERAVNYAEGKSDQLRGKGFENWNVEFLPREQRVFRNLSRDLKLFHKHLKCVHESRNGRN